MSLTRLRARAQANADYFGRPYVVFTDASGNLRCERFDSAVECHRWPGAELFTPKRYDDSSVSMLGEKS